MTYDEYIEEGWSILQYDDIIDDTISTIDVQLKPYGLVLEMANDECDGFQPIRVVKLSTKKQNSVIDRLTSGSKSL